MLYHFLVPLADSFGPFNLFRYLTFRTGGAMLTALLVSFLIGPSLIRALARGQGDGQPIRDDGPQRHLETKQGTPTMGGLLIMAAGLGAIFLWGNLSNSYVLAAILALVGCSCIGLVDDLLKVRRKQAGGLSGWGKVFLQLSVAIPVAAIVFVTAPDSLTGRLAVPFAKDLLLNLGLVWLVFALFVFVGSANAVNLTDGLDGLAIVPVMIAASVFGIIAWIVGNAIFAGYLQVHHVPGTGELTVLCGAVIGAGLGFLWFNAHPARVFMGDTGALALGGFLASVSLATRHEIVLAIVGGLFVLETLSVLAQRISYRFIGRRVFRMAPLHHHYELKGWSEATVVIRFWIIAVICALVGLATLKIR